MQSWGVTLDKDLVLDFNPIGQVVGLARKLRWCTQYDFAADCERVKGNGRGAADCALARDQGYRKDHRAGAVRLIGQQPCDERPEFCFNQSRDPKNKKGPFTLAAAGTYDTGKPNSQGRFVVVGSSSWVANRFIGFNGNSDLALNSVNWLSSDEDLISIRPKPPEDQHITMTRAQLNRVRLTSQFGFPLLAIVVGVVIWWKRR